MTGYDTHGRQHELGNPQHGMDAADGVVDGDPVVVDLPSVDGVYTVCRSATSSGTFRVYAPVGVSVGPRRVLVCTITGTHTTAEASWNAEYQHPAEATWRHAFLNTAVAAIRHHTPPPPQPARPQPRPDHEPDPGSRSGRPVTVWEFRPSGPP